MNCVSPDCHGPRAFDFTFESDRVQIINKVVHKSGNCLKPAFSDSSGVITLL